MDMMDKVNLLINKAEGTDNAAEREAYLAKADALMFKYKIDEAMLAAKRGDKAPIGASTVTHEEMEWINRYLDPFAEIHSAVVAGLQMLTGVRAVQGYKTLDVFGYEPDIRYFKMLWTSVHLQFAAKLEPKWNTALTDGENIKNLIESGQKWVAVWQAGRERGALQDVKCPPADNGKMKRLYAKECKRVGQEKMKLTFNIKQYRESFAAAYRDTIINRCWTLYIERQRMEREAGDGVSLVLKKDADAIEELMNKVYPNLSYETGDGDRMQVTNQAAGALGAAAGRNVDLAGTAAANAGHGARGEIG